MASQSNRPRWEIERFWGRLSARRERPAAELRAAPDVLSSACFVCEILIEGCACRRITWMTETHAGRSVDLRRGSCSFSVGGAARRKERRKRQPLSALVSFSQTLKLKILVRGKLLKDYWRGLWCVRWRRWRF